MPTDLLKPSDLTKSSMLKHYGKDGFTVSYLHSVVYSVVTGQCNLHDFIHDFREVAASHHDVAAMFYDCVWLVENELSLLPSQNPNGNKQQLDRLSTLVNGVSKSFPSMAMERLDPELLEVSKIITSKDVFSQKIVRVKTRLFYKQQKFNLLREESEGYSKLVAELTNPVSGTSKDGSARSANYLRSLIGCFGLDPNRVIDLIIESLILNLDNTDYFVELLHSVTNDGSSITQILGRKFSITNEASAGLSLAAARMLVGGLVNMELLYAHMSPSDEEISAKIQSDVNEAKQKAGNLNVIVLGGQSKSEEENSAHKKSDAKSSSNVHVFSQNQKLMFLHALLCEGAWDEARQLIDHMTPAYAFLEPEVSVAMARFLCALIAPLYERYHGISERLLSSLQSFSHDVDENLPNVDPSLVCSSHEDMLNKDFFNILFYIGPHLSRDSVLMTRLLRIFEAFMETVTPTKLALDSWQSKFYYSMISAFDDAILPSLSLMSSNCVVSDHIWSVLKQMPYLHRYSLYGSWITDSYANLVPLIHMRVAVTEKCRYSVKRVTKDNFKQIGRQLGKLSHSNPGPVIDHLLATVQKFDNFIGPLIDSLRYMTQMTFDVLTYSIMRTLAKNGFDLNESSAPLCSFTGQLVRRYNCEISGLLQLVTNQLKQGSGDVDLAVLREIVQKMTGIEAFEDATDDQLEATMGGDILKNELGNLCNLKSLKRPAQRLRDSLTESNLATPVFLLVAKHRPTTIFKSPLQIHLKVLGKMFDECQSTLLQYGTFLSTVLSSVEYANAVPNIEALLTEYNVQPDSAFFMARPILQAKIIEQTKSLAKQQMNKDGGTKPDKEALEKIKTNAFCEASKSVFNEMSSIMKSVVASSNSNFPATIWEELSCDLFVVFWTLEVSDIHVPETSYDRLEQSLRQQMKVAENDLLAATSGNSSSGTVKAKTKERDRLRTTLDRVNDERNRQRDHVARVMAMLKEMKDKFFPTELLKRDVIANFLQYCIFPRLLFSQSDAIFCAKFISLLHSMLLSNFSTVHCLDRIFCDITYVLSSLSECESRRYGRFVGACLELVLQWHGSRDVYDRECGTRFIISQSNSVKTPLDYENFRHLCHKWNYRISKAMVSCLESGQYVQIRNALVVLTKLLPVYPKLANHGQALEQRADRLSRAEKEHRADLYQLAFAYGGQLRGKKSTWIQERDFHQVVDAAAKSAKAEPNKRPAAQTANNANAENVPAKRVPPTTNSDSNAVNTSNSSTPQRHTHADEANGHGREDTKRRRIEQNGTSANSPAHVSSSAPTANGGSSAVNGISSSKKQISSKDPSTRQSNRDSRKRTSPTERSQNEHIPPVKQQHSATASVGGHSPSPTHDSHASSRQTSRSSTSRSAATRQTTQPSRSSSRRH